MKLKIDKDGDYYYSIDVKGEEITVDIEFYKFVLNFLNVFSKVKQEDKYKFAYVSFTSDFSDNEMSRTKRNQPFAVLSGIKTILGDFLEKKTFFTSLQDVAVFIPNDYQLDKMYGRILSELTLYKYRTEYIADGNKFPIYFISKFQIDDMWLKNFLKNCKSKNLKNFFGDTDDCTDFNNISFYLDGKFQTISDLRKLNENLFLEADMNVNKEHLEELKQLTPNDETYNSLCKHIIIKDLDVLDVINVYQKLLNIFDTNTKIVKLVVKFSIHPEIMEHIDFSNNDKNFKFIKRFKNIFK